MGRGGQDARTSSHGVKAAKEMRQPKFTEPGNDRNPTQRKDAGNKQKLPINILLALKIGPEKRCLSTWSGRSKVNLLAGWIDLSLCPRSYLESYRNTDVSFALSATLMLNPF